MHSIFGVSPELLVYAEFFDKRNTAGAAKILGSNLTKAPFLNEKCSVSKNNCRPIACLPFFLLVLLAHLTIFVYATFIVVAFSILIYSINSYFS